MAICGLRTLLLIVCILELIITIQRQVFDFLGYMWLPIIANFTNILLIIFGSFGAVQYITNYLLAACIKHVQHCNITAILRTPNDDPYDSSLALNIRDESPTFRRMQPPWPQVGRMEYAVWSSMWLVWNIFLICYYLNLGSLNRDSGLLSLGTDSVSWWEGNGWGCQPVWDEVDGPGPWRPTRVEGCFMQWQHVELGQSAVAATLAATALPLAAVLAYRSFKQTKEATDKGTTSRRPVYTIELSQTETNVSESPMKPMTPRRVKRRSGTRGNNSSVRRSRRSYRNGGYLASNSSLPRESRVPRPTSAHSSYSNFHAARPASYHTSERENFPCVEDQYDPPPPVESIPIVTNNRYNTIGRNSMKSSGYDVVGPYNEPNPPRKYEPTMPSYDNVERGYDATTNYESRVDNLSPCESPSYVYGGGCGYGDAAWQTPPPPAPPYSARATPQAPGPPAYQANIDHYNINMSP